MKEPSLGRKYAKELCDGGLVTVDGRRAFKSLPLASGATVSFPERAPKQAIANAQLALDIRFESEHCVVVHKVAGQPTAPLDGLELETLANALVARFPEMHGVGNNPLEPGLIHRLDNSTSGLLVAAKSQCAFDVLKRALAAGAIEKEYIAVVLDGNLPESGSVDAPLAPSPHNTRKVDVVRPGSRSARPAVTSFQVVARGYGLAIARVLAKRALRHQIRAHFASLGCPLANDEIYGGARFEALSPGRHALHAVRVAWAGAEAIAGFDVSAPLPLDLQTWLNDLGLIFP